MESNFPKDWHLPVTDWVNVRIKAFVAAYGSGFEAAGGYVLALILLVEAALSALPWWLVLLIVAAIGYHATTNFWAAGGFAGALFMVGLLGLWDLGVQTLALTFVSVGLSLLIGLPFGVALAKMPRARRIATPLLDAMQTLPSFVYLIPALMLFGLGKVPAVFATIIYATPPLIRLTDLGVRLVADAYTEVAADLGATRFQQLRDIELPLALPNIMAGVNQTIMMALSMVVIASMIGARGLGEQVLLGIQRLDVGQGLTAGLAIVALAIVFDRITQAYGKRETKRLPILKPIKWLIEKAMNARS
ncbi:MAG: ABC transporter permease subunit [Parvibaculum sp.]